MAPHTVFNCGQCLTCRKKRAYELAIRCVLHASMYTHNCFLTLTYDEKKKGYHNNFEYTDIQKFKKRLRNLFRVRYSDLETRKPKYAYWKKIEIFNVHEYGENKKKHWHLIVLGWSPADRSTFKQTTAGILSRSRTLDRLWTKGFHTIADVSEGTAMYQSQYVQKDIKNNNRNSLRQSHSKHSGLGRSWFLKNYKQVLTLGYIPIGGRKVPLPRYFQKLAHKHYCHFYEQSAFFHLQHRNRLYTAFKPGQENREIAELFIAFKSQKEKLVLEHEQEWQSILASYSEDRTAQTDFQKSGSNMLYDLKNKQKSGDF